MTTPPNAAMPTIEEVVGQISDKYDTDILFYNGRMRRGPDNQLIADCITRRRRSNVLAIILTYGGDPDAAYRIARCLQQKYEKFTLYVTGPCKSAGTLLALGAHELVFSDFGELGPLDVQMFKKDELYEYQSGLTVMDAITTLNEKAYAAFNEIFLRTKNDTGTITMHTAAEIATQLTSGLFSKLYAQIDPMHVGEAGRAMKIADYYGHRLIEESGSAEPGALNFINTHYPHHGFVIDRSEAIDLFRNVREPSAEEILLAALLPECRSVRRGDTNAKFMFLNEQSSETQEGEEDGQESVNTQDGTAEGNQPSGNGSEPRGRNAEGAPERQNGSESEPAQV